MRTNRKPPPPKAFSRNRIAALVLLLLAAVLGYFVYERLGMRMGGSPSSLRSPYATEDEWIVGEIVRDIAEMAAHAQGASLDSVEVSQEHAPGNPLPAVRLDVRAGALARYEGTLSFDRWLWSPESYAPAAAALIGPGLPASSRETSIAEALLDARAPVLEKESARVSELLAADMRDPLAHEEAALVLAALALREAAYAFDDVRFLLGRITAHLAVARSLRGAESQGHAGAIAEAALLALGGRQQEALEAIERLRGAPSPAALAWRNALTMYTTSDWRGRPEGPESPEDNDSLLERVQRFRAMVTALGSAAAISRFEDEARTQLPDWGRIVTWAYCCAASDSSFITTQMERELAELQEVWSLARDDRMSPVNVTEALNVPAGRLLGENGPRVLGWGTWAALYQRHIAGLLVAAHEILDESLGMPDSAAEYSHDARLVFSGLTLDPVVEVRRSRKAGARVEDTIGMDDVIELARRSPEVLNARNWEFLADSALHMMRKRGMPQAERWFSRAVLETSVIDTPFRMRLLRNVIGEPKAVETALLGFAPHHPVVVDVVLEHLPPAEKTLDRVSREVGARVEYDLVALRKLEEAADKEPEKGIPIRERMCDLDRNECADLGWAFVRLGRPVEAAASFQRAVDEAPDRIGVCNNVNWLVNYYYDQGRVEEARTIADMAADVYCGWGLYTRAYLSERMGQPVEAERLYVANAERYDGEEPVSYFLAGFYYRMARVQKDGEYEARLGELLSRVFPEGLEPLPSTHDPSPPTDGLLIDGKSDWLEYAGLRGSDVIVGLDGFRVRSLPQYDVVRNFQALPSNATEMRLRVFRQTQYLDITARLLGRRFGVRVRTYGTPGPSFQYR